MRKEIITCDIHDLIHLGAVKTYELTVMFDHDQEDGKSKLEPYFQREKIDMCSDCYKYMCVNRRTIYAYGAMGYNTYYLKSPH